MHHKCMPGREDSGRQTCRTPLNKIQAALLSVLNVSACLVTLSPREEHQELLQVCF